MSCNKRNDTQCMTWPGPVHVSVHRKQTNLRLRCLRQAHFHGLIIAMMFCLLGMIHIKVDNPSWKSVGESEFLIAENLNINSVFFIYQILGNVGCQLLVIHYLYRRSRNAALAPKKRQRIVVQVQNLGWGKSGATLFCMDYALRISPRQDRVSCWTWICYEINSSGL